VTSIIRGHHGCDPTVPAWVWCAWEERDALEWVLEYETDPAHRAAHQKRLDRVNRELDRYWGPTA